MREATLGALQHQVRSVLETLGQPELAATAVVYQVEDFILDVAIFGELGRAMLRLFIELVDLVPATCKLRVSCVRVQWAEAALSVHRLAPTSLHEYLRSRVDGELLAHVTTW